MKKRKYPLKEDFFDIIDSEEKAYILGFIYGDGYVSSKKGMIRIRLKLIDEALLKEIVKSIYNCERPLLYQKRDGNLYSCELNIDSRHMCKTLENYGCVQGKSKKIFYPDCVPTHLHNHFIRGVFDADGSAIISPLKSGKEKGLIKINFSIIGYVKFIEQIQNKLVEYVGVNKTKLAASKAALISSVTYSGKNVVLSILDWLYKDASIYLLRKYHKYQEIKKYEEEQNLKRNLKKDSNKCNQCKDDLSRRKKYYIEEKLYCFKCYKQIKNIKPKIKNYNIIYFDNYCEVDIKNKKILIDKEDIEIILAYNWHIEHNYVLRTIRINKNKKKVFYLHKEIVDGKLIRFKNGNSLDVRKENLCIVK